MNMSKCCICYPASHSNNEHVLIDRLLPRQATPGAGWACVCVARHSEDSKVTISQIASSAHGSMFDNQTNGVANMLFL